MQKTPTTSDNCQGNDRTESEDYLGVQTFIGITENNLTEVQFTEWDLLEQILSSPNLNKAYKQVVSNKGSGGIDGMETSGLLCWLRGHKDELFEAIFRENYKPNPVRRVEIPKDGGKKRQLGIPTVVDRLIQQSISQILSPIYERGFSGSSYGVSTRLKNLIKCGIGKQKAREWANTRKGYWRTSGSFILSRALTNDNLRRANYPFLMDCYRKIVS